MGTIAQHCLALHNAACGWSRRYNQSGALARAIERQSGVKVTSEALRRIRPTQQQIGLSRSQRASNVQGAFKVAAERAADIQGRRVVLIDDVLTSGATADACARALLRARAAQVDVLVFARVVDTYKAPILSGNLPKTEREMTAAIEIYTRPGCGYCGAAKSLLMRKKAAFVEFDVAKAPAFRQEMWDRAGAGSTFPPIFIGASHLARSHVLLS